MAFARSRAKKGKAEPDAQDAAGASEPSASDLKGPSSDTATNLLVADLALRGGAMLVQQGIERGLLGRKYAPGKAMKLAKGRTWGESLLHGAVLRLATRSVPGAIVVGGGLLAKTLHDRRKARKARNQAPAEATDTEDGGEEA